MHTRIICGDPMSVHEGISLDAALAANCQFRVNPWTTRWGWRPASGGQHSCKTRKLILGTHLSDTLPPLTHMPTLTPSWQPHTQPQPGECVCTCVVGIWALHVQQQLSSQFLGMSPSPSRDRNRADFFLSYSWLGSVMLAGLGGPTPAAPQGLRVLQALGAAKGTHELCLHQEDAGQVAPSSSRPHFLWGL